MNLDFIKSLIVKFKVPVGLSDHTPTFYNALGAVSLGASIIEKHFTFNKSLDGPDHKSSIDANELKYLVEGCRANFLARGNIKKIHKEEQEILAWARSSVVTKIDVKKNEKIDINNITTKRPTAKQGEISSKLYNKILGKRFKKDLQKNIKLRFSDLL
jgi:sialic acid synthase SpsE